MKARYVLGRKKKNAKRTATNCALKVNCEQFGFAALYEKIT